MTARMPSPPALPSVASPIVPSMARALTELLDWQLWYWGQDIHHEAGNALLAYGFERHRGPNDGTHRSTAYRLTDRAREHGLRDLVAWGFGVTATHSEFVTPARVLLLLRHERSPGLCREAIDAKAGTRDLLPERTVPRCADDWCCLCTTLAAVAHGVAEYEVWARDQLGGTHRQDAHRRRPREVRRRHELPLFLDGVWLRLADRLAAPINANVMPSRAARAWST